LGQATVAGAIDRDGPGTCPNYRGRALEHIGAPRCEFHRHTLIWFAYFLADPEDAPADERNASIITFWHFFDAALY
jgi:hypothetical protein